MIPLHIHSSFHQHSQLIIPSLHYCSSHAQWQPYLSLVPRPSHCPVFDRLQYAKMEEGGLVHFIILHTASNQKLDDEKVGNETSHSYLSTISTAPLQFLLFYSIPPPRRPSEQSLLPLSIPMHAGIYIVLSICSNHVQWQPLALSPGPAQRTRLGSHTSQKVLLTASEHFRLLLKYMPHLDSGSNTRHLSGNLYFLQHSWLSYCL